MNAKVLIVSSSHRNRTAYTAILSGYGYQVAETKHLNDAHNLLLEGFRADVILVDLHSANAHLGEFVNAIRYDLFSQSRVIVMGGDVDDLDAAQNAGADAFLYRPVDIAGLLNTIKEGIFA